VPTGRGYREEVQEVAASEIGLAGRGGGHRGLGAPLLCGSCPPAVKKVFEPGWCQGQGLSRIMPTEALTALSLSLRFSTMGSTCHECLLATKNCSFIDTLSIVARQTTRQQLSLQEKILRARYSVDEQC
jgi:hypothetical protein